MMRLILNLLLACAFLANGFAVANGHQAQADQPACQHQAAVMDHAAMSRVSHQEMMAMVHFSSLGKASVKSRRCCGDAGCKCGCALPTVVIAPAIAVSPQSTSSAPSTVLVAHAAVGRSTAPYRPPSV